MKGAAGEMMLVGLFTDRHRSHTCVFTYPSSTAFTLFYAVLSCDETFQCTTTQNSLSSDNMTARSFLIETCGRPTLVSC